LRSFLISLKITHYEGAIYSPQTKGRDATVQCERTKERAMKSLIVKRSIVLNGHKTSVSLEDEFWDGLREIAELQKTKLSTLVQNIDLERRNANLSSAVRLFVLTYFRGRAHAAGEPQQHEGGRVASTFVSDVMTAVR
jgi:predicted DNA-binding ribbon-helix-helix protein